MRDFSNSTEFLGLNTATLGHNVSGHGAGWSTEQVIDACAERQFGGITFWRREFEQGISPVQAGERVRAAGMQVSGLCRTPFLVGPLAPPTRSEVMDDFKSAIDMCADLKAASLVILVGGVELGGSKGFDESLRQITDILQEACTYAASMKVNLSLEPLHPMYGGNRSCIVTTADAIEMCQRVGSENLGLALDVYHIWWDRQLANSLAGIDPKRIMGFHLCDWLADTNDMLLERGMMGDGVADIKALRSIVENAGYQGVCEVEIFSANDWWLRDPNEVLDICRERFKIVC